MSENGYILDKGYEEFNRLPELQSHLGAMAVRSMAATPFKCHIVDYTKDRKQLKRGMVLAIALAMAARWKETIPDKRVGVVFPAGIGGLLTNLALTLIDKVPVNLNFSAGRQSVEKSLEIGGVETIISAKPIKQKFPEFPWPERTIDLVREQAYLNKKDILKKLALVILFPGKALIRKYDIPTEGGDREAGLLFSSGSTGTPKGIGLTHRNIIANCIQIERCHLLNHEQVLLACLPTFHSFGFTATMWYPMLFGLRTVTLPSPLETRRIADAIQAEKVTVMMGTPTFFRPYFKRATKEQLASLQYVVGGAEKTPPGFHSRWEQHFGSSYLEGYGLTETSPVVSINLPPYKNIPAQKKEGSVGRLIQGMRARVVDPVSGKTMGLNEQGILDLQGANIFSGYLNDEESNSKAFCDGWFRTGDLARIDPEGYIFIEGRISRFSKLGGEMVPHGKVEQVIAECFQLEDAESPLVAVTGVSDEVKGEALVVLSAVEIQLSDLRERLTRAGIPNLWIPKIIVRVDAIPSLASGKLDLKALNLLAQRKMKESG